MADFDLKTTNLYELFELESTATESDIKKAYRKKALIYHPDKNQTDPHAKELFQKLSKALEILTDEKARASYDKILRARQDREVRNRKFDAKRKKLRDDLEEREKFQQKVSILEEEERLKREIERIRAEGSRLLQEENELLKKKLQQQRNETNIRCSPANTIRVKLKRNRRLSDVEITDDLIEKKFGRFGPIRTVAKMKKSALLEYDTYDSLKQIAADCPSDFEFEIINVNRNTVANHHHNSNGSNRQSPPATTSKSGESQSTVTAQPTSASASVAMTMNFDDYENYVLRRMQEAKKRKAQSTEHAQPE